MLLAHSDGVENSLDRSPGVTGALPASSATGIRSNAARVASGAALWGLSMLQRSERVQAADTGPVWGTNYGSVQFPLVYSVEFTNPPSLIPRTKLGVQNVLQRMAQAQIVLLGK